MTVSSIELEAQLIERAVAKRNDILTMAEERASRVLQAAERERERIRVESDKQVLTIVGSELRAIRDRIIGKAELDGRKMLMQARDGVLSSVFSEAETRLRAIAEGRDEGMDYGEVLIKLIIEAASAMGGGDFIVAANDRDLRHLKGHLKTIGERVRDKLGEVNLQLDDRAIEAIGGVDVRNADGSKMYHNTLEERLLKARRIIEAEVAKTLGVI